MDKTTLLGASSVSVKYFFKCHGRTIIEGLANMYMLSECELIDTKNISLLSQNMKFVVSINHIHIQMTCLSSLNQI
jgi:hypothetical protein